MDASDRGIWSPFLFQLCNMPDEDHLKEEITDMQHDEAAKWPSNEDIGKFLGITNISIPKQFQESTRHTCSIRNNTSFRSSSSHDNGLSLYIQNVIMFACKCALCVCVWMRLNRYFVFTTNVMFCDFICYFFYWLLLFCTSCCCF